MLASLPDALGSSSSGRFRMGEWAAGVVKGTAPQGGQVQPCRRMWGCMSVTGCLGLSAPSISSVRRNDRAPCRGAQRANDVVSTESAGIPGNLFQTFAPRATGGGAAYGPYHMKCVHLLPPVSLASSFSGLWSQHLCDNGTQHL